MTVTNEQARQCALALPEAIEQDHHGRPVVPRRREDLRDAVGRGAHERDAGRRRHPHRGRKRARGLCRGLLGQAPRGRARRSPPRRSVDCSRPWFAKPGSSGRRSVSSAVGRRPAPASRPQCPAGGSQPSSTGGFQSVPTVFEPCDPGSELGLRELRVLLLQLDPVRVSGLEMRDEHLAGELVLASVAGCRSRS